VVGAPFVLLACPVVDWTVLVGFGIFPVITVARGMQVLVRDFAEVLQDGVNEMPDAVRWCEGGAVQRDFEFQCVFAIVRGVDVDFEPAAVVCGFCGSGLRVFLFIFSASLSCLLRGITVALRSSSVFS